MTFLSEFDSLFAQDERAANQLLYERIIHSRDALFEELRAERPLLRFWSHHPGNPDTEQPGQPGYAYLLTRGADVKFALENFSMAPYQTPLNAFVLMIDDKNRHTKVREAMARALHDAEYSAKIDAAVYAEWDAIKGGLPNVDVREYVRNVALRFTGAYFGIPDEFIFSQVPLPPELGFESSVSGSECLKQWSGEGYENFIWKIHARHFGCPNPDMRQALLKIASVVGQVAKAEPNGDHVIGRFLAEVPTFSDQQEPLRHVISNIVGAIQGLVDNVMTGACYALNQIILQDKGKDIRGSSVADLVTFIREIQRADTPSPFLPRRGDIDQLPSFSNESAENANFACAIGAALNDPDNDPGWEGLDRDIRLGYGMHVCIGRDVGDEIKARALLKILAFDDLRVAQPLEKQWGWIVKRFSIAAR